MTESDLDRPTRWTWLSYGYATLVVVGVSYLLLDIPIQVSDSYGNLVAASGRTLGALVYDQFHARGFLRPFLWAHIRIVYDLSGGDYYTWFRGWHVGQVAVLTILFLRLVKPRTAPAFAGAAIGLAALIGIHTFEGTILEAFPINAYMTILICCYLAADLALGQQRKARAENCRRNPFEGADRAQRDGRRHQGVQHSQVRSHLGVKEKPAA